MKLYVLTLVFCCALVYAADEGVEFEVGGKPDKTNIKELYKTETPDDSESGDGASGDNSDDTESSGSGAEEEGSGKGIDTTPSVVVIATKPKKNKSTSRATTGRPKTESKSTVEVINEGTTDKPTQKTTEGNDPNAFEKTTDSNEMGNGVQAASNVNDEDEDNKSGTVNFTVGIIVGVVVGAILAILVIVFLVYRLRKKDEGSYSLDEPSSQAFIRDEKTNPGQGKEYFA